jgi:hypothetical protein
VGAETVTIADRAALSDLVAAVAADARALPGEVVVAAPAHLAPEAAAGWEIAVVGEMLAAGVAPTSIAGIEPRRIERVAATLAALASAAPTTTSPTPVAAS